MKFSVNNSDLKNVLLNVISVVPAKTTFPIIGNILLNAKDGKLHISATDLEVTVETFVPVEIEEEGGVALPARIVGDIVRQLPDTKLDITIDKNKRANIKTESGEYMIAGENESEFPELPKVEIKYEVEIEGKLFEKMIKKSIFAVSPGEVRSSLMGVYIQLLEGELRTVATDGHRLVKIVNKGVNIKKDIGGFITSPKALNQFLRNKSDDDGIIKISVSENYLVFSFNNYVIYSRLIEGTYPEYENVIPKDNDNKLIVEKGPMESSVKRISIFSNKVTQQIKIKLMETSIEISSEDVDYGKEGKELIPAEYKGEDMVIGYNYGYLLDVLEHMDTEKIMFNFGSPTSAGLVYPIKQEKDEDILILIMPIKLTEEED